MYLKQKSNSQPISRFCIVLESLFESKREQKVLIIILNWKLYINRKWFVSAKGFIDTKTITLWMALGPLNTYYYHFYDYYYCII